MYGSTQRAARGRRRNAKRHSACTSTGAGRRTLRACFFVRLPETAAVPALCLAATPLRFLTSRAFCFLAFCQLFFLLLKPPFTEPAEPDLGETAGGQAAAAGGSRRRRRRAGAISCTRGSGICNGKRMVRCACESCAKGQEGCKQAAQCMGGRLANLACSLTAAGGRGGCRRWMQCAGQPQGRAPHVDECPPGPCKCSSSAWCLADQCALRQPAQRSPQPHPALRQPSSGSLKSP